MANKTKNKAKGAKSDKMSPPSAAPQIEGDETSTDAPDAAPSPVADGAGTTVGAPTRRNRRSQPKNFVGIPGDGGVMNDFDLTDAAGISSFVRAYGRMGETFDGGYETHFNGCGPMCRKGVERIGGTGKAKVISIFADALAEDAALAGSANHGLSKGRSPEEAERLLVALHAYIGNLIVSKRAEIAERALAKAAADLGIPVEKLKALKAAEQAA